MTCVVFVAGNRERGRRTSVGGPKGDKVTGEKKLEEKSKKKQRGRRIRTSQVPESGTFKRR